VVEMAFYNEQFLEEIKTANDIQDVISEYVTLKRTGTSYKGLCPFHKEKTPSFSVSADKQIFHCFGCGMGGDVIRFISLIENVDFKEAVEILADRSKIELPNDTENIDFERVKLKERLFQLNAAAARYFYNNLYLPEAKDAINYIKKREMDNTTVKKFGLGFSFGHNNDLRAYLKNNGFTDEEMVLGGLIIKNGAEYADRFRQRVMFPIFDIKDRIIAFGGRVIDSSLPKYMNSPETPIYSKSKNIYGLNFARKSKVDRLLIVEGYMDVISLHKNGIPNAVASLGTALTETQGRLLRKYSSEVIVGYDSDAAGQAATIRGLDILSSIGCNVKVMTIIGAKDPDEFVNKNGPEKLIKLMDNSATLVEFKLQKLKKEIGIETTDGKIEYLNKMADIILKIENSIEREVYIKKVSSEIGVGEEAIYAEINKRVYGKNVRNIKFKPDNKEKENLVPKEKNIPENVYNAEKMVVYLLCMNDKNIFELIKKNIDYTKFKVNLYRELTEILYNYYEKSIKSNIIDLFEDSEQINVITGIMQEDLNFGNNIEKAIYDLSGILKKYWLEEEKDIILKKLQNRENDLEIKELEGRLNEVIIELCSISAGRRK
jgi:DNA primase